MDGQSDALNAAATVARVELHFRGNIPVDVARPSDPRSKQLSLLGMRSFFQRAGTVRHSHIA